ncbi:MAG: hypothetical protein JXD23_01730 [Spirochaetales bacterium]|nr:hypothetical protein [Spirochaetales bacterium]
MGKNFLLWAAAIALFPACAGRTAPVTAGKPTAPTLSIVLAADKTVLAPGREARFTVTFTNAGSSEYRLFENETFFGDELVIAGRGGKNVPKESGFNWHSPKVGFFPGRTFVLPPGGKKSIVFDAYLDSAYRLVFAGPEYRKTGNDYGEFKKKLGLSADYPDKFASSSGRLFKLDGPGVCAVSFIYEKTDADRHWKLPDSLPPAERSLDRIWIGKAESNALTIEIKR